MKTFLTVNALFFFPFGVGMLLIPSQIFPLLGVNLDHDGQLMSSTVGSMLLSFAISCWIARNENSSSIGVKAVLWSNFSFHFIDFILTGKGAITEVMNPLGFVFSITHLSFAIGFLYFINYIRKSNSK